MSSAVLSLPLHRSNSQSTGSHTSAGSAGVDELTALFAAGNADAIADGLLQMRTALTRDSPDTVHTLFSDLLPDLLHANATPFTLVLKLLAVPELLHRPAGKVDLRTLLVRALRSCCDSVRLHSLELNGDDENDDSAAGSSNSSPPPAELTVELTSQARDMCLRVLPGNAGPFFSPRTFEAVVSLYRVELARTEMLRFARSCFDAKRFRDAAEFLRIFRIEDELPAAAGQVSAAGSGAEPDDASFPFDALFGELVSDKANMDAFVSLLSQSPAFLARHAQHALTVLAERPGDQSSVGGNDPNLAAKLIHKFGLRLRDFPRVRYLKVKEIIWWCCRVGKGGEFGQMLAGEDDGLQRKLLREMSRSRATNDHLTACSFLELPTWRHHLEDPEYAAFYTRQKQLYINQAQSPQSAAQRVASDLTAAVALHDVALASGEASSNLLLPALAPSSSSAVVDLPQLFLQPRAIVMVDSLETLEEAKQHLLSEECRTIGLDLEHLPENFAGLEVQPVLCQLLQVACSTKVFLFDLQLLVSPNALEAHAAAASAAVAPVGSTASAAAPLSAASTVDRIFPSLPPLPAIGRRPAAASAAFVSGVNDLLCALLMDEDITKLGIGFASDLRKLRMDFPNMLCFQLTLHNYADLTMLLRAVEDPDAEAREGHKKRTAHEAKKRAAERKKRLAVAKANAKAAASKQKQQQQPPPRGGLSSLFGDDEPQDDEEGGDEDEGTSAGADVAAAEESPAASPVGPPADSPAAAAASTPPSIAAVAAVAAVVPAAAAVAPSSASASVVAVSVSSEHRVGGGGGGGYIQHGKREGGLAKLCRMVLRRTLDKSEQISDWSKRPLSDAQIQYAALDAYVCLLIAEHCDKQLGIELDIENIEAGSAL
jgi:hypothetical protein